MTEEQADELLANSDWAKWSDARDLLLTAAHMGAKEERERCARWAFLEDPKGYLLSKIISGEPAPE